MLQRSICLHVAGSDSNIPSTIAQWEHVEARGHSSAPKRQAGARLRNGGLLGFRLDEQAERHRGLVAQRRAAAAAGAERARERLEQPRAAPLEHRARRDALAAAAGAAIAEGLVQARERADGTGGGGGGRRRCGEQRLEGAVESAAEHEREPRGGLALDAVDEHRARLRMPLAVTVLSTRSRFTQVQDRKHAEVVSFETTYHQSDGSCVLATTTVSDASVQQTGSRQAVQQHVQQAVLSVVQRT
jgi:hypothetical protein